MRRVSGVCVVIIQKVRSGVSVFSISSARSGYAVLSIQSTRSPFSVLSHGAAHSFTAVLSGFTVHIKYVPIPKFLNKIGSKAIDLVVSSAAIQFCQHVLRRGSHAIDGMRGLEPLIVLRSAASRQRLVLPNKSVREREYDNLANLLCADVLV